MLKLNDWITYSDCSINNWSFFVYFSDFFFPFCMLTDTEAVTCETTKAKHC